MKAKSGKAAMNPLVWGVFLWIFVPAGLFFAGYKLVGPKIGEVPVLKDNAERVEKLIAKDEFQKGVSIQGTSDDPDSIDSNKGPEIEIKVEKATGKSSRRSKPGATDETLKPKKKKKKTEPKPAADHVRDDASGDAAMTGGNDRSRDPAGGGQG